ncbi:hypothetical protein F4802DRAFT_265149 [Xylaria palmicola]|nr:hypothetical protein F4802DRAFT_265149 [Xylaria palmicola]
MVWTCVRRATRVLKPMLGDYVFFLSPCLYNTLSFDRQLCRDNKKANGRRMPGMTELSAAACCYLRRRGSLLVNVGGLACPLGSAPPGCSTAIRRTGQLGTAEGLSRINRSTRKRGRHTTYVFPGSLLDTTCAHLVSAASLDGRGERRLRRGEKRASNHPELAHHRRFSHVCMCVLAVGACGATGLACRWRKRRARAAGRQASAFGCRGVD